MCMVADSMQYAIVENRTEKITMNGTKDYMNVQSSQIRDLV